MKLKMNIHYKKVSNGSGNSDWPVTSISWIHDFYGKKETFSSPKKKKLEVH